MKKILLAFAMLVLLAPLAHAATLTSSNGNRFDLNEAKDLYPITITATAPDEITAEHGMDIFLGPVQMLWDVVPSVTATGKAVDDHSIAATIVPTYKNGYQIVHIPVLATFKVGDDVTITGLRMRAYKRVFSEKFLQVDLNGDGVGDAQDINRTEVQDIMSSDFTPPYPVTNVTATLSSDLKSVTLTWLPPPDYDYLGTSIDRTLVRSGSALGTSLITAVSVTTYVDTNIKLGDTVTYSIYATDGPNNSTPVVKTVEIKATTPANPPVTPQPEPQPAPQPTPANLELDQLSSLYGYYKTRQAIKCRIGISPTDSACLWAKIDVVYAQKLLGRSDVNISLSTRDLYLMALRIVWPEKRYQTECVKATVPDKSCPALEKSIKRAHYFID